MLGGPMPSKHELCAAWISMEDSVLEQLSTEHDLGVMVDSELTFREAASAVSKATQILASHLPVLPAH